MRFDLEDLPHAGVATAEKLRKAGYTTIESIARANIGELARATKLGDMTAARIIISARAIMGTKMEMEELDNYVLEPRPKPPKLSTLWSKLDEFLGGGIGLEIIEFTSMRDDILLNLIYSLLISTQVNKEDKECSTLVIDCNRKFRVERLVDLCNNYGVDPERVIKNVFSKVAEDSYRQILVIDKAFGKCNELLRDNRPPRLIIVNDYMFNLKHQFPYVADRLRLLHEMLYKLRRLSSLYKVSIVLTNKVKDSTYTPSELLKSNIDRSIYLSKRNKNTLRAKLILPEGELLRPHGRGFLLHREDLPLDNSFSSYEE
jgi:DNA repair protein RadA